MAVLAMVETLVAANIVPVVAATKPVSFFNIFPCLIVYRRKFSIHVIFYYGYLVDNLLIIQQ